MANYEIKGGVGIIPEGTTAIEKKAFRHCSDLTSITIPDTVTTIGNSAFRECYELTSVHIGNGVTTIGNHAFEDCSSLTNITIPDSVTTIGENAFDGCYGLTSVYIGEGVTTIGECAFENCSDLTQIEVSEANTVYSSIDGVLYNKAKDTILHCPRGRQGRLSIPETVTTIGEDAFDCCKSLTSIVFSGKEKKVQRFAFSNCTSLTHIFIPTDQIKHYRALWPTKLHNKLIPIACMELYDTKGVLNKIQVIKNKPQIFIEWLKVNKRVQAIFFFILFYTVLVLMALLLS